MNNSELVTQIEHLLGTSRFSQARKVCLAKFIGKQYSVTGILSRVSNTPGYLRRQGLRKGKTITLQLTGSDSNLSIRCNLASSGSIADHNVSDPFTINVTITGYDDVRRQLEAEEIAEIESTTHADAADASAATNVDKQPQLTEGSEIDELLDPSAADNHADRLLDELEQMQLESHQLLAEVAGDIIKAQSSNVVLVGPDTVDLTAAEATLSASEKSGESPDEDGPGVNSDSSSREDTQASSGDDGNSRSSENEEIPPQPEFVEQNMPTADIAPSSRLPLSETEPDTEQKGDAPENDIASSEIEKIEKQPGENRLEHLRRELLSDQNNPIVQKDFGQIVSLETGVPIEKVKEIQQRLWQAIMSPSMFGKQRDIFNFFPFGDFRLMRNRGVVKMDFKSAPVPQLAKHEAVEEYPHSNFDGSDADTTHPPIATHAIRIAAIVAPLVGLSSPVTYDVIFETLQLLLKVFGIGKRRVRFTDIGEFFPVVLRGTLQYHFRPYRPLIRFATESFRAIILLAEREGDGQLAFEADNGVPDRSHRQARTVGNRVYSRPVDNTVKKKKTPIGCIFLVMAVLIYQALKFAFN
jgi:hypothetical protein